MTVLGFGWKDDLSDIDGEVHFDFLPNQLTRISNPVQFHRVVILVVKADWFRGPILWWLICWDRIIVQEARLDHSRRRDNSHRTCSRSEANAKSGPLSFFEEHVFLP